MLTTFSGRNPSQNEFELASLIAYFRGANVTSYLEIGARHGDTFHAVMMSLPKGSRGVAVDLPGGMWGKKGTENALMIAANDLIERGYIIDVILGDSTDYEIIDRIMQDAPYDACLIDGDHRYDGVKKDFMNYRCVAPITCFHDIVGYGQKEKAFNNEVEVPRLWEELKVQFAGRTSEFVGTGSLMGIGIIDNRGVAIE